MDYSYLNQTAVKKPRKRLCTWCLEDLGLKSIKSQKGTYQITHGTCERHFREKMLTIGLTEREIDNKVNELKDQYHAMAFCADLDQIL